MAIRDWPAAERPREKLLQRGAAALSDAELLAIFLRTGVVGVSAVDLARQLISDFGGLRPLLEADCKNFCRHKGLGEAKYVQLQATLELGRRHLFATLQRGDALTSPDDTRRYLTACLRGYGHEVFAARSSTTATASSPSRSCSVVPSTAPRCIHARWSSAP